MPVCPKCKNEYREGVTTCSDCGCELIKDETEKKVAVVFGEQAEIEELAGFLRYSQINDVEVRLDETDNVYEIFVPETESKQAAKLVLVYKQEKAKEMFAQNFSAGEEEKNGKGKMVRPSVYQDSATKAEENKSSAYTLLFVGVVGMIVIVLGLAGVLPIHLGGTSKYLTYGIMSALFLLFIVMGVLSMKSYRIFAKKAESEHSLKDTIEKWCKENMDATVLDEGLFDEDVTDEEKYFKRTGAMKEKIKKQFLNLDDAFLDDLVDGIYSEIFPEE